MKDKTLCVLWKLLWCLLLLAAVAVGAATRLSYIDMGNNQELLDDMPYAIHPFSVDELGKMEGAFEEVTAQELYQNADIVVLASRSGERTCNYKAFLTSMVIHKVIKGDTSLEGRRVDVFEPVGIYEWPSGRTLLPADAYMLGGMLARENVEYVLFLREAPASVGIEGYVLLKSPYAKMPVGNVGYCIAGVEERALPLKELAECDVVVCDEESLDAFRSVQGEILKILNSSKFPLEM